MNMQKSIKITRTHITIKTPIWELTSGINWSGFMIFRNTGNGWYAHNNTFYWIRFNSLDGYGITPKTLANIIRYMDHFYKTELIGKV